MYFLVGFPPFLNSKHWSVPGPRFRLFMFMCTLILWMSSPSYILLNITRMWRSPIYVTFCDQVLAAYSMSQSRISWAIFKMDGLQFLGLQFPAVENCCHFLPALWSWMNTLLMLMFEHFFQKKYGIIPIKSQMYLYKSNISLMYLFFKK